MVATHGGLRGSGWASLEDRSFGRVLEPWEVGISIHGGWQGSAALHWYHGQSCSSGKVGPTKGALLVSSQQTCSWFPEHGQEQPVLPLTAIGKLGYPMALLPLALTPPPPSLGSSLKGR